MEQPGFIEQLVDWRDFEQFVRDLFGDDPNLIAEHDLTEVGKSGARRQIDVKLTHHVGGMSYVTVIECKRWKEKVDRGRIDILAATIRDLNAAKGVMFTTSGFEEGAERYARDQGIELFVVRDLTDTEWGLPGRVVSFWWRWVGAEFGRFELHEAQLAAIVEKPPKSIKLDLQFSREAVLDEQLTLHSVVDGEPGPNLMSILLDGRYRALETLAKDPGLFGTLHLEEVERHWLMPIEIDLSEFPARQLLRNYGAIKLERIGFELIAHVSQTRFQLDRGERFDFALAVENYVTRQRNVVARSRGAGELGVFRLPDKPATPADPSDVVSEDTVLCVFMEPWVAVRKPLGKVFPTRKLTFRLPSWDAEASDAPARNRSS